MTELLFNCGFFSEHESSGKNDKKDNKRNILPAGLPLQLTFKNYLKDLYIACISELFI